MHITAIQNTNFKGTIKVTESKVAFSERTGNRYISTAERRFDTNDISEIGRYKNGAYLKTKDLPFEKVELGNIPFETLLQAYVAAKDNDLIVEL